MCALMGGPICWTAAATAEFVVANCRLTQNDDAIVAKFTAYNAILSLLVAAEKWTAAISSKLMQLVHDHQLPLHTVTNKDHSALRRGNADPLLAGQFSSRDALLTPHYKVINAPVDSFR